MTGQLVIQQLLAKNSGKTLGNKYRQFLEPVAEVLPLGFAFFFFFKPRKQPPTTKRCSHGYHSRVDKINLIFFFLYIMYQFLEQSY